MNEWGVFFLGVIALAAVVQCVFVVVAAKALQKGGSEVVDFCRRFDTEIKPALVDLKQGAANLRAISESGRQQAARVEDFVGNTLDSMETVVESVRNNVLKPMAKLSEFSAFWGGLKQGIDAYRSTGPRPTHRSSGRRSDDSDEHMFIG